VTTPFDTIAATYTELWSATPNGIEQRLQVWRKLDTLFTPGQHILDLGCGIGDDALHLTSRGLRVTAIDASQDMIAIARHQGIDARRVSIEQLSTLGNTFDVFFDGALSNFGAFNCIAHPDTAARDLAQLLRPGAHFAMCVLSRFYWRESIALNSRRWSGHTIWRGLDIFYRTSREWQQSFSPHFKLLRRVSIGSGDHTLHIWRRS
jgi:2-polyprenyl-3-methyl-5-hydroxy-6-metoxy-1,4-benzoquinol methylase